MEYKEGDLLVAPNGKDGAMIISITHGMNGYVSYQVVWTGHPMPVRVYKEDLDYAVSCGYEVRRERS